MSDQYDLPATGFVRLAAILGPRGPIPVAKSTWYAGVKSGRFPRPLKLGPRIAVWRVEDIRALIRTGALAFPLNQPKPPTEDINE
jgi:prophage regulatory protein